MQQDEEAGSMWRGLLSLLSTLELEPGQYVLRLSDPRPTQDGLILNEVSFTVEPPESERPTSESRPSNLPPGWWGTFGDGIRAANATLLSLMDDPSERESRKRLSELLRTLSSKT
jgi:hypothetical protein